MTKNGSLRRSSETFWMILVLVLFFQRFFVSSGSFQLFFFKKMFRTCLAVPFLFSDPSTPLNFFSLKVQWWRFWSRGTGLCYLKGIGFILDNRLNRRLIWLIFCLPTEHIDILIFLSCCLFSTFVPHFYFVRSCALLRTLVFVFLFAFFIPGAIEMRDLFTQPVDKYKIHTNQNRRHFFNFFIYTTTILLLLPSTTTLRHNTVVPFLSLGRKLWFFASTLTFLS